MSSDKREPIEGLLRQLPLRRPSAGLDERVRAACTRPNWGRQAGWGAAVVAAAALAAGLACLLFPGPAGDGDNGRAVARSSPPPPVVARAVDRLPPAAPIRIEQVWSTVASKELVDRGDQPPVERLRQQVVRRVQWIDDRAHVSILWNMPSEHTVLVPLDYN